MVMKRINREKLSQLIRLQRQNRGLSQSKVAALLGVSERTVSRWETGVSLPSMDDVVNICNVFNLSLEELFDVESYNDNCINENINSTKREVNELKRELILTNTQPNIANKEISNLQTKDKSRCQENNYYSECILLAIVHLVSSVITFLHFGRSILTGRAAVLSSIIYVFIFTILLIKNSKKTTFIKGMVVYSLVLLFSFIIGYYLQPDVKDYEFVLNETVVLLNGSMLGFSVLTRYDMTGGITISCLIYLGWIVLGVFFLNDNQKRFRRLLFAVMAGFVLLIITMFALTNPVGLFLLASILSIIRDNCLLLTLIGGIAIITIWCLLRKEQS